MLVYGYHHAQNGAWIVSSLFVELIFIKQHHKRLQSRPKVHPGKMEEKGKQGGAKKSKTEMARIMNGICQKPLLVYFLRAFLIYFN